MSLRQEDYTNVVSCNKHHMHACTQLKQMLQLVCNLKSWQACNYTLPYLTHSYSNEDILSHTKLMQIHAINQCRDSQADGLLTDSIKDV